MAIICIFYINCKYNIMSQPALLVDCFKIINWLEQRKKLPKDWYNYQKAAQQKLKILLKDQQQYQNSGNQNLIPFLKQHTQNFHYCDIVQFVNEILKTKWAENKSLVFGYSDKRVKQWVNLKKFMDNKQIAIVNTAKFINQGLNFDLPSLDKNVELLDNQISNLKRKIDFNTNTIYQQDKQSLNQKNKIGLKATNDDGSHDISVVEQIPNLIRQVPQLFQMAEKKAKQIEKFYDIYSKYCESCQLRDSTKLLLLEKIIYEGNTFVKNPTKTDISKQQKYAGFYNWKPYNEWGIQIEGQSSKPNIQNYQTILESRPTRLQLIEDLNQLLYFYQGVKYEQSLKSNLTTLQSQNNINLVESQLIQAIKLIEDLLTMINGDITTRVELKNSSKAYQILLRKFRNYEQNVQQIKKQNEEYEKQIEEMKIRRQEIVIDLRKLRVRLVKSKNQCEKYLTDFIKREIRITGEINKLE